MTCGKPGSVERVYDVTDSHWNSRGGYIAYAQDHAGPERVVPQAQAIPRSEFDEQSSRSGPGGDLAQMLGIADRLPEDRLKLVPRSGWHFRHTDETFPIAAAAPPDLTMATERAGAKLPRAVLFRDSFAAGLIPFLAEHFERMLCIWDHEFDRAVIEHERPGVVIQEVVERSLEGACRRIARCVISLGAGAGIHRRRVGRRRSRAGHDLPLPRVFL